MPSGPGGPPPAAAFAFAPENPFDPGFQDSPARDPEVPPVPDSVLTGIRRMYAYLVDLFPQAAGSPSDAPPPRALFEEFFSPSATPHQPVFLSWFERVHTALSDADSCLASLLASSRAESGLLPPCLVQYAVRGEFALGSVVPVNPFLLSMFDKPLRPSPVGSFRLGSCES